MKVLGDERIIGKIAMLATHAIDLDRLAGIEAIVDALLESDQMESTARYLTSGRRFAHLETEEIKKRWTQAAGTFLILLSQKVAAVV
jgi:hypothetical protein